MYVVESRVKMEVKLYVGNLPGSTTEDELQVLFAQAGDVTAAEVIKDRHSGLSRGFAFVAMSAQSEADKAVSMFNLHLLSDHVLKVSLAKPREQRGVKMPNFEL